MSAPTAPVSDQVHRALCKELLRLAQHEEDAAAREAQRIHYWESMPVTVAIHRQCAAALRAAAEELSSPSPSQPARG